MTREISSDLVHGGDVASSNSKVLNTLITEYSCIRKPNQPPHAAATPGDGRYLTSLWVFRNREKDGPESPSPASLMLDQNIIDTQTIQQKITSALKTISFREPRVFIQFWSPVLVHKRCWLTTLDQPFGLGIIDEGLYLYRRDSEQRVFVVDCDYKEKELGPPGRVYEQKLPEWSFDVHGLSTRQCVKDWAACYNIHGYIDLPVFEPTTGCCVGVLELITSSNYVDYAFEVREISRALKKENLKCSNVFEDPSFCTRVEDERRQHDLDQIFSALKMICDIQKLPLAQTWGLSGFSSFVANSGKLEKTCNSFNKSCIGKVCMSTSALPFYVRDLSMWQFHEACRDRHLDKSQGVVGRSLSSQCSYFCENVTKFSEYEYPFIHIASMNGITSCLVVYLKSIEVDHEYVIELFLPPDSANRTGVQRLVETVKQEFKKITAVQLGIMSSTQVVGGIPLNWNLESTPVLENKQNDVDVTCSKKQKEVAYVENDLSDSGKGQSVVPYLEKRIKDFEINPMRTRKKRSGISFGPGRKRKKTDGSISLEEIKKLYGKTIEEAAISLHVSRSTLKRICRSYGIARWPYSKGPNESDLPLKSGRTYVVIRDSERALTPVFGPSNEPLGATNTTHDPATLTEHSEHSSTLALHQQEQKNDNIASTSKVKDVIIKATFGDNIVKFPFRLSDGLGKLEGWVATRFQLKIGSFNLKYVDEEGDMILITCDSDLKGPNFKTVIKLLVQPVAD